MIKQTLAHLHWSTLPIFSMLLFLAVFIGAWLWVYRKNSQEIYQKVSQLALDLPASSERKK